MVPHWWSAHVTNAQGVWLTYSHTFSNLPVALGCMVIRNLEAFILQPCPSLVSLGLSGCGEVMTLGGETVPQFQCMCSTRSLYGAVVPYD